MTIQDKLEVLLNNIEAANYNTARTDSHVESLHDFEIRIITYNSVDATTVEIESATELNEIITNLLDKIKHLTFRYIVKDYRINGIEKGYAFIHYPNL
jgi:hypothetical protein